MGPAKGDGERRIGGERLEAVFERAYRCAREVDGRTSLGLREWVQRAEAWRIVQVLKECGGNRSAAARALGIGRRTLYNKIDRLAVEPAWSFGADTPFQWNRANPIFGLTMNTLSFIAPAFERHVVLSVREAMRGIEDPEVMSEAEAFLQQEGLHAKAHRTHVVAPTERPRPAAPIPRAVCHPGEAVPRGAGGRGGGLRSGAGQGAKR